jgi:hypothetical protein
MSTRNTIARTLHDAGLAAWFGGSLMGAVGLNGATTEISDPTQRSQAAAAGWARWTPVNLVAIGAHLVGGAQILQANRHRVKMQKGVATMTVVKSGLTGAALVATAYSRILGQRIIAHPGVPVAHSTGPTLATPTEIASAQKQLQALQWVIPALTGGIVAANAYAGEQMHSREEARGVLGRAGQVLTGAAAATKIAKVTGVTKAAAGAAKLAKTGANVKAAKAIA